MPTTLWPEIGAAPLGGERPRSSIVDAVLDTQVCRMGPVGDGGAFVSIADAKRAAERFTRLGVRGKPALVR